MENLPQGLKPLYRGVRAARLTCPGAPWKPCPSSSVFFPAVQFIFLKRKPRCNLNLPRGVKKAAVVGTGYLTIRGLIGCGTAQCTGGGEQVSGIVDAVEVLVVR